METISPSASVHDLVNILNTYQVGALVVSADGKRIDGIVSERDVVRAMPGKLNQLIDMHVRDLMTVEVTTCTSGATIAELMTMMTERRIHHVPVVDENGKLVEITKTNFLFCAFEFGECQRAGRNAGLLQCFTVCIDRIL